MYQNKSAVVTCITIGYMYKHILKHHIVDIVLSKGTVNKGAVRKIEQ
jgi:hypothetical protein